MCPQAWVIPAEPRQARYRSRSRAFFETRLRSAEAGNRVVQALLASRFLSLDALSQRRSISIVLRVAFRLVCTRHVLCCVPFRMVHLRRRPSPGRRVLLRWFGTGGCGGSGAWCGSRSAFCSILRKRASCKRRETASNDRWVISSCIHHFLQVGVVTSPM